MSRFHALKFKYWSPTSALRELIDIWNPTDCKSEKDYENSLYAYLRSELPDMIITQQYGFGRARADLGVGDKVVIEIKIDLTETSEFQRLLGQIAQFKGWNGFFLVLLIGSTDPNLLDELRKHTREIQPFPFEPKVSMIEKKLS